MAVTLIALRHTFLNYFLLLNLPIIYWLSYLRLFQRQRRHWFRHGVLSGHQALWGLHAVTTRAVLVHHSNTAGNLVLGHISLQLAKLVDFGDDLRSGGGAFVAAVRLSFHDLLVGLGLCHLNDVFLCHLVAEVGATEVIFLVDVVPCFLDHLKQKVLIFLLLVEGSVQQLNKVLGHVEFLLHDLKLLLQVNLPHFARLEQLSILSGKVLLSLALA